MKRSDANKSIEWGKKLLDKENIRLPEFAYWDMSKWIQNKDKLGTIKACMLGWDVSDYGLGNFKKTGGVLFTVRNGDREDKTIGVPYAEKYILFEEGQGLPTHFHYTKTEDIINRSGGVLALKIYNASKDESIDYESDVVVYTDGIKRTVRAGEIVKVPKGGSISLTPFMYHNFWALEGHGDLVCGEVSSVNNDNIDNRFSPELPRFTNIEEDEAIVHPLCNEYDKIK